MQDRVVARGGNRSRERRVVPMGEVTCGEDQPVVMTAAVKDELARLPVAKTCCRRAEVCSVLRFSDGVRIRGGRVVVQAELDTGAAARRLCDQISELVGQAPDIQVIPACGRGSRYLVRMVSGGESLARHSGLLDRRGRPVRGLPFRVVSGGVCEAEAVWRGAFLVGGSLTESGRSLSLGITSPGPEAALALVGAARRLGVTARTREAGGSDQVVVREADAIAALLTRLGAPCSVRVWQQHRMRCPVRISADQPAALAQANQRRSAQVAVEAVARVQRALDLLGEDIPEHLLLAGRLRLEHPQASLDQLGQLADPPMTKDVIAGRIRRLLVLGDNHARHRQD
jgi:cell division protein WhiA